MHQDLNVPSCACVRVFYNEEVKYLHLHRVHVHRRHTHHTHTNMHTPPAKRDLIMSDESLLTATSLPPPPILGGLCLELAPSHYKLALDEVDHFDSTTALEALQFPIAGLFLGWQRIMPAKRSHLSQLGSFLRRQMI